MTIRKKMKYYRLAYRVWLYLAEHPNIKRKDYLPKKIYNKIKGMRSECPLCEIYYDINPNNPCEICILTPRCECESSYYMRWCKAATNMERVFFAGRIALTCLEKYFSMKGEESSI